jgi:putative transposase
MTAGPSIDMSGWLHEHLDQASPDLLREMVRSFAQALMSAEADVVCGAGYGERSDYRVNTRNGYRPREWDTRAGSIDLQGQTSQGLGCQAARGAGCVALSGQAVASV